MSEVLDSLRVPYVENKCEMMEISFRRENIIAFLLIWIIPAGLPGQPISFLDNRDGLSQNSIFEIFVDNTNIVWIATQRNLDRFDGDRVTSFFSESEAPYGLLVDMFFDKNESRLWVASQQEVICLKLDDWSYMPLMRDTITDFITDIGLIQKIAVNHRGNLLLISDSKYFELLDTVKFQPLQYDYIAYKGRVNDVLVTDEATYLSTDQGILRWLGSDGGPDFWVDPGGKPGVMAFDRINQRLIIACKNSRLYEIGLEEENIQEIVEWNKQGPISCIQLGLDGTIYVGTRNRGVFYLKNDSTKFNSLKRSFSNPQSLRSNLILSLGTSSDSVIWIGTNGRGITYLQPGKPEFNHIYRQFSVGNSENLIINNDVWDIQRYDESTLWLGTDGNGVARCRLLKDGKWDIKHYPHLASGSEERIKGRNEVTVIEKGPSGHYYLATDSGVYLIKEGEKALSKPWELYLDSTEKFLALKVIGDEIFAGSLKSGQLYRNQKKIGAPLMKEVRCLDTLNQDKLLVGTYTGLLCFDLNENEQINIDTPEKLQGEITGIFPVKGISNEFWITTLGNGLIKAVFSREGKILIQQNWTIDDGLPSNVLYGIIWDCEGDMWLSSNRGLVKVMTREGTNPEFRTYNKKDGIQHDEFNTGAFNANLDDCELFWGGVNGVSQLTGVYQGNDYFDSKFSIGYASPTRRSGEAKTLESAEDFVTDPITLENDFKFISMRMVAPFYQDRSKLNFSYRIYGKGDTIAKDSGWVKLFEQASFFLDKESIAGKDKDYGSFVLEYRIRDDGISKYREIRIEPTFWQANGLLIGFLSLVTVIVIVVLIVKFFNESSKAKRKSMEVEKEIRKRLELESRAEIDKLGQDFTNTLHLEDFFKKVQENDQFEKLFESDTFSMGIYDPETRRIIFSADLAFEKGEPKEGIYYPIDPVKENGKDVTYLSVEVYKTQKMIVVDDYHEYYLQKRWNKPKVKRGKESRSVLYLPLVRRGKVLGVVSIQRHNYKPYDNFTISLFQQLANYLAVALDNIQQLKREENKTITNLKLSTFRSGIVDHFLKNLLNTMGGKMYNKEFDLVNDMIEDIGMMLFKAQKQLDLNYTPLTQEIDYLKTYLKLSKISKGKTRDEKEKLKYEIDTTGLKDVESSSVPSLVLQIFVENAVKHGIESLNPDDPGLIRVEFKSLVSEDGFECVITDNGPGIDLSKFPEKQSVTLIEYIQKLDGKHQGLRLAWSTLTSLGVPWKDSGEKSLDSNNDYWHPRLENINDLHKHTQGTRVRLRFQPKNKN